MLRLAGNRPKNDELTEQVSEFTVTLSPEQLLLDDEFSAQQRASFCGLTASTEPGHGGTWTPFASRPTRWCTRSSSARWAVTSRTTSKSLAASTKWRAGKATATTWPPEFDAYVEQAIAPIAYYTADKHLLGYFTDNELPWKNDALDRHLQYLGKEEPGYLAARKWFDTRKGKAAGLADITPEDQLAFSGYYFETYIQKVAAAVRKYDPNHLYLGCRFNQETEELNNPEMFRVAGKYADVISINHYRKWEPVQSIMANWTAWSGKPFIITEWYTKGEDSGLPNRTGAGWNVSTQQDRGYFYQNFTIELLKSKACVGWHWFTYQDNDPLNMKTDPSNRDSNKGVVNSNFTPYTPMLNSAKLLNDHTYELIQYLDK